MHEAKYYEPLSNDRVHCELCPHQCVIGAGKAGKCRVRRNDDGQLVTTTYGLITSAAFDPIEKKPLYHFKPGATIFSIGSKGCNFSCGFCQNAHIALENPEGQEMTFDQVFQMMSEDAQNVGIAFTYNEPTVNFEFVLDMAKRAKEKGLTTVCVSNGYIMPDPLEELLRYVDAFNIDLKAFNDRFYHEVCGGERAPVMESIRIMANTRHVEVTLLLIEGENDDPEELAAMFAWLKDISADIVLHINRYHPAHHYTKPPTAIDALIKAQTLAKKYLNYVYIGNVADADISTYCPHCGTKVIDRSHGHVAVLMEKHACQKCGKSLAVKL